MLTNFIWTGLGLMLILIALIWIDAEHVPADRSEDDEWVNVLHAMNVAHFAAWVENATVDEVERWLKTGRLAVAEWVHA